MHTQVLVSVREAASMLGGISQRNLWSLTTPRGPIPCVRLGRRVLYRPADLAHYVEQLAIGHRAVKHRTAKTGGADETSSTDNPVCATGLKILEKLKAAPGQSLTHSVLLKRMKIDSKSFHETIKTLIERGDIAIDERRHEHGRPATSYRLVENAEDDCGKKRESAGADRNEK